MEQKEKPNCSGAFLVLILRSRDCCANSMLLVVSGSPFQVDCGGKGTTFLGPELNSLYQSL